MPKQSSRIKYAEDKPNIQYISILAFEILGGFTIKSYETDKEMPSLKK